MIDFHGSTGYGQAFTDSIRGDWGGKPLEDLKKGLEAGLAKYPWMDGGRVAALGASFGGYMVNWIAGNWPDRFRCLVSHDGNLCERAAYYDTEELWFPNGTTWARPGTMLKTTRGTTRSTTSRTGRRRCSSSTGPRISASSIRKVYRPSPPCNGAAFPASSSTSPTRTTGCSSRTTASFGTRPSSHGWISGRNER